VRFIVFERGERRGAVGDEIPIEETPLRERCLHCGGACPSDAFERACGAELRPGQGCVLARHPFVNLFVRDETGTVVLYEVMETAIRFVAGLAGLVFDYDVAPSLQLESGDRRHAHACGEIDVWFRTEDFDIARLAAVRRGDENAATRD